MNLNTYLARFQCTAVSFRYLREKGQWRIAGGAGGGRNQQLCFRSYIFTYKMFGGNLRSGGSRIFLGGGANPHLGGATYNFINISRKLHEIKKKLVAGGGGAHAGGAP